MATAKSHNSSSKASPKSKLKMTVSHSSTLPTLPLPSSPDNDTCTSTPPSATSNNNTNSNKNVFRPVVFQCRQCRSIVADSADLSSADALHRIVAFRRPSHPNVVIKPEWQLRQEGLAFGSVFQALSCKNCDADLGVRYHTTNADTDHLRGFLTLKTEALLMYELQFDEEKVKRDIEAVFSGALPPAAPLPSKGSSSVEVSDVEITKLQKFCLVLYDRVVRLEEQVIALTAAKL